MALSGIGLETARLFLQEGAKVVLVDIDANAGGAAVASLDSIAAVFVQADVSISADVERVVGEAERLFGKVNILFNNAGIMHLEDTDATGTTDAVWDLTMAINAKGVFYCCKHGIPALRRAGGGSVINTASFVARMGAATAQIACMSGNAGCRIDGCLLLACVDTASKGAVLAMTRELAIVHARENIRVNALCPGPLETPLLMAHLDTEEKLQRRLVHLPMGRFGRAQEVAQAALFLASDESSFVTGTDFLVDGGLTAAYVTPEEAKAHASPAAKRNKN